MKQGNAENGNETKTNGTTRARLHACMSLVFCPHQAECTCGWLLTVRTVLVKANPMAMQPQMRQPAAMTLALQAAPSSGVRTTNMRVQVG